MSFSNTLAISASALTAERLSMDVIANNIANSQTTGAEGPYQRQRVVVRAASEQSSFSGILGSQLQSRGVTSVIGSGVRVVRVEEDESAGQRVYEPDNADADEDGYVTYPNVNVTTEIVNLLAATKAYQANVTVINATKSMAQKALSIGAK